MHQGSQGVSAFDSPSAASYVPAHRPSVLVPSTMYDPTAQDYGMILINLLPPELRKSRGSEFNPLYLGVAACFVLALVPAGFWGWVKYSRIPYAKDQRDQRQADLDAKTAEAQKVETERARIADFEAHRNLIIGLLSKKVYWAKTIDQFGTYLSGPWTTGNSPFEVSCTEFSITPIQGARSTDAKSGEIISVAFKAKYKLLGLEQNKAGDYIKSFFLGTETGAFWNENGFIGKPEATYRGDSPDWNIALERVKIEFTLDWVRKKTIAAKAKGK